MELYHYGIKGMKWGVRRRQKNDNVSKNRQTKKRSDDQNLPKAVRIGGSVCAAILAGELGSRAVFGITESETMAKILAPSIAVYGGLKYYDWISKPSKTKKQSTGNVSKKANESKTKENTAKQQERINTLFKKHPDLYDDFGGPDKIDDPELLQLVMWEKGYGDL